MVDTIKFSEMPSGGDLANNEKTPGLLSGENVLFNNPWTFLPPGSTAARPAPSAAINYRLRFNTDDQVYEYYDAVLAVWTQLQESAFTVGPFVTYTADASLPDAQNLGILADGIIRQTITLGVATLDIAVNGVDYYGPGFTGYFESPAGVKDVNGNIVYQNISNASAVNYLTFSNRATALGPILGVGGLDATVQLNIASKGSAHIALFSEEPNNPFVLFTGTGYQHETVLSFQNTANTVNIGFQDASGTLAFLSDIPAGSPSAMTKVDDTNVTLTLGGTPATSLLQAVSLTLGWAGQLGLTRGGSNASLTASNGGIVYSTATAMAILSGTATPNLPLLSGTSSAPSWGAFALNLGGALTTAAAHVLSGAFASTFTFTGITGVTFPTSGTLATTSQLVTPAALTKTDDTNVTLTLGGSPSTALVNAASLTLGWTGQLSLTRGGSNASLTASNGGIVYSTASALAILAGTATANQMLLSGASGAPAWSTATHPATTTINQILYSSAANVISGLATANSAVLVTSSGGVPSLSTALPSGLTATNMTLTTPSLGVATATSISFGGSVLSTYAANTAWTPTMTFATPGDLSIAYTTQSGTYSRIGNIVCLTFVLAFAPTFTTASGSFQVTGLPFAIGSSCVGTVQYQASAFPAGATTAACGTALR